ncbi:MAG: hypothetical protein FGM15_02245 [Chthoniobacterales bacterium]|nr:hypothetical protein [Chthoniobacterales bacterium]
MIRGIILVLAVYAAVVAQEFLPSIPFLAGARLLVVPVVFCYGALWMPFPAMLGFALYTGLLSDLSVLHVVGDQVEIGLGWSMLFYVVAGTFLHAARPLFLEGRWEVHCLGSAAVTLVLLVGQYLMVCLRRGSFLLDGAVFWNITGPALAALFLAPPVYFFFQLLPEGASGRVRRGGRLSP